MNESQRMSNVKTFIRVMPTIDVCHDNIKVESNRKVIRVRCLQDFIRTVKDRMVKNYWRFQTDGVFHNVTQEEIYQTVIEGVIPNILAGCDGIILVYGPLGSGKSFTISGLYNTYMHRGIAPRLLSELFEQKRKLKYTACIKYSISMTEIRGSTIRDLLAENWHSKKSVRTDPLKTVTRIQLQSADEGLKLLFEGHGRCSTADDAPYKGSNLGHVIITIHTHYVSRIKTNAIETHGKLHLIDMAGFNSLKKPSEWRNIRDVAIANVAKTSLQRYLMLLIEYSLTSHMKESIFMPQRLSILVRYLGDSLSTTSLIRFVGHIRATMADLDFTISTLRFNDNIRGLTSEKLKLDTRPQKDLTIINLNAELKTVKQDLEITAMLQDQQDFDNISQSRMEQIQRLAEAYLKGETEDLQVLTAGHAYIILQHVKDLHNKLQEERESLLTKISNMTAITSASVGAVAVPEIGRESITRLSTSLPSTVSKTRGKRGAKREETQKDVVMPETRLVGERDKESGITVGSAKTPHIEGGVVRLLRRQKTKETYRDSITEIIKENEVLEPSPSLPEDSELKVEFPIEKIPSRDEAWKHFLAVADTDTFSLESDIQDLQNKVQLAHNAYVAAATDVLTTKAALETARMNLMHVKHHRYFTGEIYDSDGHVVTTDEEKRYSENVRESENELRLMKEAVNACKNELTDLNMQLFDSKQMLEDVFQKFCRETYHLPALQEVHQTQIPVSTEGECKIFDQHMKSYQQLQEKMLAISKPKQKPNWKS